MSVLILEVAGFISFLLIILWIITPEESYTKESWEEEMDKHYSEEKWLKYQETEEFKKGLK